MTRKMKVFAGQRPVAPSKAPSSGLSANFSTEVEKGE